MTERQIKVYLSVSGTSGENIYRSVIDLIKSVGHQVVDAGAMAPVLSVPDSFQRGITDLIQQSDVFIGILAGSPDLAEEHDGVVIETGRQPVEIEYAAARALRVPQLLYVRESVLDRDSWLARFFRQVSKEQRFRGFTYDEELLKWLPEDLMLITGQQPQAFAGRGFETDGTDLKIPEQSLEEGYNEHFEAARDRVAQLYEKADALLKDHNPSAAAEVYREITDILPNELEAYVRHRDVLERLGRTEEAKQVVAEIEERFPSDKKVEPHPLERPSIPPPSLAGSSSSTPTAEADVASSATRSAPATDSDSLKQSLPGSPDGRSPGLFLSADHMRVLGMAWALARKLGRVGISRTNVLFGLFESSQLADLYLNTLGISRDGMLEVINRRLNRARSRAIALTDLQDAFEEIDQSIRPAQEALPPAVVRPSVQIVLNERNVLVSFNGAPLAGLALSDNLRDTLAAAQAIAVQQGDNEISTDQVFVSLMRSLDDAPGFIAWMLGKEKREWIQKTLSGWPRDSLTEEGLRDKAIAAGLYSPPSASSDAASKDDLLNFKQSAQAMVNIVLKQETVPPLVIGVYGPWGSGKSTYLELVKKSLLSQYDEIKKRSEGTRAVNLLVVEYDAWAYSDAPKLWAGLITKIARKLDEDLGFWGRIKYLFKTHRARFLSGLLLGLIPIALAIPAVVLGLAKPLTAWLSAAAGPMISVLSAWLAQRQAVVGNVRSLASKFDSAPASGVINSIQDEFKDALESWIEQKTGADAADATIEQRVRDNNLKIVVFIDELDRCPLERIVDILEAIKLFLAKEIFIVFMAVDTRVASEAIRLHYKDVRNPDLPREYLEKIVQLPLRVPTAKGKFLGEYLKKFMPNVKDDEASDGQTDPLLIAPPAASPSRMPTSARPPLIAQTGAITQPAAQPVVKPAAAGARKSVPRVFADPSPTFSLPQLPDTTTELKMLEMIAERFLESNPRRIKRLLNTYRYVKVLSHSYSEPVQTDEWQKTMLGWLSFTMTWPAFIASAIEKVNELEPNNTGFLLRAIEKVPGNDSRPTREDVQAYLNVSGEQIKSLWELAGNFLIENADPGSVSHSDAQENTRVGSQADIEIKTTSRQRSS